MEQVNLDLNKITIPFIYTDKASTSFYNEIKKQINKKVIIITDNTVKDLYVNSLIKNLEIPKDNVFILSSPQGEQHKNIKTILSYLNSVYEWGIDRSCLVICFGGGISGNMGGLVAGLIYRGINFIHIPTTIIAAFDSVISLKQAVNSDTAKNAIGLYHTPKAIYSNMEYFKTLSKKEIRSGICETIKNALAIIPASISGLSTHLKDALELKEEAIKFIKDISIKAKQMVMKHDEYEKKTGLILEYGHTVGHAIELIDSTLRKESITHGEAVGLGMLIEAEISYKMGYLSRADLDMHYQLLSLIGLQPFLPNGVLPEVILKFLQKDNKKGYIPTDKDHIGMVLLSKLGSPVASENLPITPVPLKTIDEVLQGFPSKMVNKL